MNPQDIHAPPPDRAPQAGESGPDMSRSNPSGEKPTFAGTTNTAAPTHADGEEGASHSKPAHDALHPEEKPDQLADKVDKAEDRQEALLDEGVEESFPASDPVSVKRIT